MAKVTDDDLMKLRVWAEISITRDYGLTRFVWHDKSKSECLENLKEIVLTEKGKKVLGRPTAKKKLKQGRWYNKLTGQTYAYKGDERFGLITVGVKGGKGTHRILADNLGEY